MSEDEMSIDLTALKELNQKHPEEIDYIKFEVDRWGDELNKNPPSENIKIVHLDKINEDLIFYRGLDGYEFFKQKKEILDLLNEENIKFQYLDLGEINEEFYYGFKMQGREAIIISSGKIYRNTEEKVFNKQTKRLEFFGENEIKQLFNYDGYIGDIAPTIAKETIKKYFVKAQRNHLIKPKEIYKTIRDKITYYMDFSGKDEIADVLTCWIIATYCYPIFLWFPHILFTAPSTSGKSKGAYIVINLSFRGFDLGASGGITPPQIFRTIEGNRGTFLCDEFEQNKKGAGADAQQLVNQIYNSSASRDAYVIRVEQIDGKWVAKKFPIFCPKISCNISGINPTSLSRFIGFSWLKTKTEKGKKKPQKDKEFSSIQQQLYLFMLENYKSIKEIYENIEINLNNRDEDNWLPLYSIAEFIDQSEGDEVNATSQLNKYVESYKDLQIETNDNTEDFFNLLFERVESDQRYYTPKEIGEWREIQDLLPYLKSPAHWVGRTLKAYKFQNTRGGGTKRYLLSKDSVKYIIDLYFKREITPNTTIYTQSHKQHITTPNLDKKDENVVLGGVSGIINEGGIDQFSDSELKEAGWTKETLQEALE